MSQATRKPRIIAGFVTAALFCGAALVFAAVGIYQPQTSGDWIRDAGVYQPGTDDQINVLADIQPGTAVQMLEVGLRLNALSRAGKKKSWDVAAYQAHEMEKALDKVKVTRPSRAALLDSFITTSLASVNAAIAAQDKTLFKAALKDMQAGCNGCHVNSGKDFLVVKAGKSAIPLR